MKLSTTQLRQFEEQGFLVIDGVLDANDRQPLFDEYAALIDRVAAERGVSDAGWSSLDFEQRLTMLLANDPDAYEWLDISLPMLADLDHRAGVHTGPAVFNMLKHPAILDIVESVIGPEIVANPVQHARIKPPESVLNTAGRGNSNMARTGWHQDAAVIVEEADSVPMLTVWIAITDASRDMGCMQAVPGSHRWPALGQHCPGRTGAGEIYIPSRLVECHQPVDLEVSAGGIVLLHKRTWHGAGPNMSERVRWSFDLRYQPPGYPTGRECFPDFLARSRRAPEQVLDDADEWASLWRDARREIASGRRQAVFNVRWEAFRTDPLCA